MVPSGAAGVRGLGTGVLPSLLRILLGVMAVYAALVALAWYYQDRMALPGTRGPLAAPVRSGIRDGEVVEVRSADGVRLRGWYLPPSPAPDTGHPAPGLLWFYGNMESVTGLAPIIRWLRPPGVALLILDYRGYGESTGTPSEAGLYADAEAAWSFLAARPEVDPRRIAVYGRSVGSVPALYLATAEQVRALVLDSPLSNARDMARVHYPLIPRFILRLSMDNLDRAARLTAPLLVFHGANDDIAPPWMGRVVAQAGRARELVLIEGAGHNETYDVGGEAYRNKMLEFLAQTLR